MTFSNSSKNAFELISHNTGSSFSPNNKSIPAYSILKREEILLVISLNDTGNSNSLLDGEILGAFERYNTSDFRSNFGSNATSKEFELPESFKEITSRISSLFNIEYAGIDLLFGEKNEPVLCEINSNAFFEEFEKVTHINVAKKFMEMVKRKIYEQK